MKKLLSLTLLSLFIVACSSQQPQPEPEPVPKKIPTIDSSVDSSVSFNNN